MAIDDLLDEHEQSERVRSWLRNNGAGLIAGVVVGLALIFGWQWWQKRSHQQNQQAYTRYEQATKAVGAGDLDKASADVTGMGADAGVYGTLAQLSLAKAQVDGKKLDDAISTLRSVKPEPALRSVVNQRLARLLIETGKPEEAIKVLGDATLSSDLEVRGDALLASGKPDEAKAAYQKALASLDVAAPERRLVEIKLTHVGGTPPEVAESI
ncbi:MAG: tetratricopeptide repeat protein [Pseudoxanthomonas sp.]